MKTHTTKAGSRAGPQTQRPTVRKEPRWLWLEKIAGACQRFAAFRGAAQAPTPAAGRALGTRAGETSPKQARAYVPRLGESDQALFRSERLFAVGHRWYFATRGGEDVGPFRDRHEAELALAAFVARNLEAQLSGGLCPGAHSAGPSAFEAMVAELVAFYRQRRQRSGTGAYVWALRRTQTLRGRIDAEPHARMRLTALEYVLREVDAEDRASRGWSIGL